MRASVSVMDVLQMVSAPSNYAVDTGGTPAQRSLRTYTHREKGGVRSTSSTLALC